MAEKVLELKNLSFAYEAGENVLENIGLEVYEGEYIGIVGSNGSAKSTLMKLMLGLIKSKQGSVSLLDSNIERFSDWGSIAYLSQQARSFNKKFPATVSEIVGASLYSEKKLFRFLNRDDKKKIRHALEVVGMEDFSDRLIGSLSGGQQQRVFIARLLVGSPKIIFMDEPLVGVDMRSQKSFYDLLDRLNKDMNITIIMVTHDLMEIINRVDRVFLLNEKSVMEYDIRQYDKEKRIEMAQRLMTSLI